MAASYRVRSAAGQAVGRACGNPEPNPSEYFNGDLKSVNQRSTCFSQDA
jgi:hypothetical protein